MSADAPTPALSLLRPATSPHVARGWRIAAYAMVLASMIVVVPFAPWLVLASWFARAARPTLTRLSRRLGGRGRAAAVLTLALLVAMCGPVIAVATSLTMDAIDLGRRLSTSTSGREALATLVASDGGAAGGDTTTSIMQVLEQHGERALSVVSVVAGTTLEVALGLFVFFSAAYFLLVEGTAVRRFVDRHAPIASEDVERLAAAFHETGRGLFIGIGATTLAQAVIATITFALLGVPRALVLGFVTFFAGFIPSVGTGLVWVPVATALAMSGRTTEAIVLSVVGVVLISSIDNVLRPQLTHWGHLDLHPFVVLVSMLGGLAVLGGWGLIIGPLVVRLTTEVLRIASERRFV